MISEQSLPVQQYLVLFTSQCLVISSHHQARPEITVLLLLLLRISSKLWSSLVISYLVRWMDGWIGQSQTT